MGDGFIQKKSIGKCILFSFLTCGIYSIYWLFCFMNDLYYLDGSDESAGKDILLGIVTCGIYYIFLWVKAARLITNIRVKNNLPETNNAILFVVLSIFGLSIINFCIIQDNINAFASLNVEKPTVEPFTLENKDDKNDFEI